MTSVLVLQHVEPEPPGLIVDFAASRNVVLHYVRVFDGDPVPDNVGGNSGLLVMGGPFSVYEQDRYPFLAQEIRLIRRAVGRVPVLGVCLGSQLLAAALGAQVRKGAQKEIGWYAVTIGSQSGDDALFRAVPRCFNAFHWHGDIFSLPAGAVPLASSGITEHQAFRYGDKAYGLLFHLEVTPQTVKSMTDAFGEELKEENLAQDLILEKTAEEVPKLRPAAEAILGGWLDMVVSRE